MLRIPKGRFIRAMQFRNLGLTGAIAELFDNSFGEERGDASTVCLHWNSKERILTISDDGCGMADVGDLFQLGAGKITSADSSDIGLFGAGGTEAIAWLSDLAFVWTLRSGQVSTCEVSWPDLCAANTWPDIPNEWHLATTKNCPRDLLDSGHGTRIELYIPKKIFINITLIKTELARLYSPWLRGTKRILVIDGYGNLERLKPWTPENLVDKTDIRLSMRDGLRVDGYVGWSHAVTNKDSYISVCFSGREIFRMREPFFGCIGKLWGFVELSRQWRDHLTTTKESISGDDLREELIAKISKIVAPLREKLQQQVMAEFILNFKIELGRYLTGLIGGGKVSVNGELSGGRPSESRSGNNSNGANVGGKQKGIRLNIQFVNANDLDGAVVKVEFGGRPTAYLNNESPIMMDAINEGNKIAIAAIIAFGASCAIVESETLLRGVFKDTEVDVLNRSKGELVPLIFERISSSLSVESNQKKGEHNGNSSTKRQVEA